MCPCFRDRHEITPVAANGSDGNVVRLYSFAERDPARDSFAFRILNPHLFAVFDPFFGGGLAVHLDAVDVDIFLAYLIQIRILLRHGIALRDRAPVKRMHIELRSILRVRRAGIPVCKRFENRPIQINVLLLRSYCSQSLVICSPASMKYSK